MARTQSLNTAAFCIARGIQLNRCEPSSDGRNADFIFDIPDEALAVQEGAFLAGAPVSGYAILAAQRQLKRLIRQILI